MKDNDQTEKDQDLDLVLLCKRGDADPFETLVERHQKKMLNIAYRFVGDYDDACEIVQDAFVSAYKNIRRFKGTSKFSTWLYAIVVNLSKNRLKLLKTRRCREPYSLDDPVMTEDGYINVEPAANGPTVLEELEKRDVREKVQGCIAELEPEFRETVILRDIQGFSYDEISDMLKIPGGTVKSRLYRAREAVKNCLKKTMGAL